MLSAKFIFIVAIVAVAANLQSTAVQGLAVNPWKPQWMTCEPGVFGAICSDCTTRIICTKAGGKILPCFGVTAPYCNLGKCSATPTAECAPGAADVPAEASADVLADVPDVISADVPADEPAEVSADAPADVPIEVLSDVPAEVSADVPTDVPAELSADVPTDVLAGVPADAAA